MMKVFVVEDEEKILAAALEMLADLDVQVLGHARNVEEAFNGIISKQPDLVLLDIELGNRSSLELLERFEEIPFKIVFTTAHQKYAFEAFRFSAIDYLLKPLSTAALREVVEKAGSELAKDASLSIQTLQYNLANEPDKQKLILKTQEKIHVLNIKDIIHCESDLSYTIFHTLVEKIIVSKTLRHYDELLSKSGFYRIHKSHLINLQHVAKIHKPDGGEVEMSNGARIGISQRKKEEFLLFVDSLGLT